MPTENECETLKIGDKTMRHEMDVINDWKNQETSIEQDIVFMLEYMESAEYKTQSSDYKRTILEVVEKVLSAKKQWAKSQCGFITTFTQGNIRIELDYTAPIINTIAAQF